MNAVKKLAIVLSLGALSVTASAATSEKAYVASYEGATEMPVPVKVVAPDITTVRGAGVVLEFVIDKAGVPQDITVAESNDAKLAEAAIKAVEKWRFTPRMKNGETVTTKARLPVVAELPSFADGRLAMN